MSALPKSRRPVVLIGRQDLSHATIVKAGCSEGPEHLALIGRCEKTFLGVVALMLHSHGCPINLSVPSAIFEERQFRPASRSFTVVPSLQLV